MKSTDNDSTKPKNGYVVKAATLCNRQHSTIASMIIVSILVLTTISYALALAGVLTLGAANAQVDSATSSSNSNTSSTATISSANNNPIITSSSHIDSSPVVAVIVITNDNQGNPIFLPNSATIKPGEEILVLNNDTKPQMLLNGNGPNDPLSGKLFSIGAINPKAFLEYGASNLQDGRYPFYLQSEPNVKGELVVISPANK
jgi:hypothetical protein